MKTGPHGSTKYACPSCKSTWVRRGTRTVYTCQTCDHVFGLREAVLATEINVRTKQTGQKAGPITIGQQCMKQWR